MTINGKEIKTIRPMTKIEIFDYLNGLYSTNSPIFCIEFIDGTVLSPKGECINCMSNNKCLFTLAYQIP
jgi:hypothetical protein